MCKAPFEPLLSTEDKSFSDYVLTINNQHANAVDTLFRQVFHTYNLSECMSHQINRIRPLILSLSIRGKVNVNKSGNMIEILLHLLAHCGVNVVHRSDKKYIDISQFITNILISKSDPMLCIKVTIEHFIPTSENKQKIKSDTSRKISVKLDFVSPLSTKLVPNIACLK